MFEKKKSVKNIEISGKRIFLRVDYNVPIENRRITDDFRITSTLPTISYILENNVKQLVIGSHLGRPKGEYKEEFSLNPVYEHLKNIIKQKFKENLEFKNVYDDLGNCKIVLLENLRFLPEEELKGSFVKKMEEYFKDNFDLLVVEAFGCLHREALSINKTGLPAVAGLLVEKELLVIEDLLENGVDLVIMGGCKVSDKTKLIKNIIMKTKSIYFVGGMCFTFLKDKKGVEIGNSIYEPNMKDKIDEICEIAEKQNVKICLPEDFIISNDKEIKNCDMKIPMGFSGCDVCLKSVKGLTDEIQKAKSIFWNGPPGIFEKEEFNKSTKQLIKVLEDSCKEGKKVIIGGGDTASAVNLFSDRKNFTHVSTGGGSLLTILEGGELPGLNVIQNFNE